MEDVTTTASGPAVTADAARDGLLDVAMVLDGNGDPVDDYFKAALPNMRIE
jgi:hypothetical protein